MTIGHLKTKRRFAPNPAIPGGSRPGVRIKRWPWFVKMVAESVVVQWAGSRDAVVDDRRLMPLEHFWESMRVLLPGFESWCEENRPGDARRWAENLRNRVYKMYYSGTSDRGPGHDPATRARVSSEHWKPRVASHHPWLELSEGIVRGTIRVLPDWRRHLEVVL